MKRGREQEAEAGVPARAGAQAERGAAPQASPKRAKQDHGDGKAELKGAQGKERKPEQAKPQQGAGQGLRELRAPLVAPPLLNDRVRDKVRSDLALVLGLDACAEGQECADKAVEVEQAMLARFKTASSTEYKNKYRQLFFNLKNPRNSALREQVRCGDIPPNDLCDMDAKDMADPEIVSMREKAKKDAMRGALDASTVKSHTNAFKCGKCKQRKCSYFQLQTRSADEPMTTFVKCEHCGNQWKC